MPEKIIDMLRGNTNTLGRTEEVVELIKQQPLRINELFELYFQEDEWVRLRVSSSLKRIWRHDKSCIAPFIEKWINEVSVIDQPSINWTFTQMVEECAELLNEVQQNIAVDRIKKYMESSSDWIVLNSSIQTLASIAKNNPSLAAWLMPRLEREARNSKKSDASRAKKAIDLLS